MTLSGQRLLLALAMFACGKGQCPDSGGGPISSPHPSLPIRRSASQAGSRQLPTLAHLRSADLGG